LLQKLNRKQLTKDQIFKMVQLDFSLLPILLEGTSSSNATIRYSCGKILMNLSLKHPDRLYPYMESLIKLLDSKYRILTWNAMAIIANLTVVDADFKFDAIFDKYYNFLSSEYMITVSNLVGNSRKIALAKPYLSQKITTELLKVQDLKLTPHLTDECKLIIAEQTIKTFDSFFEIIEAKDQVLTFTQKYLDSSRPSLKKEAQNFLRKWN